MSLQAVADRRATELHASAGLCASCPPGMLELAQRLLGADAVSFVGKVGERGAALASVTAGRCRISLHRGLPIEENVVALARGIAGWDVSRGGPARNVELLALSIALPREVMNFLHDRGVEGEKIATEMHVPVDFVRARERAFFRLRRVPRDESASVPTLARTWPILRSWAFSEIANDNRYPTGGR